MLTAQGLSCTRGSRALFSSVALAVGPGQWAYVRGENGAGKTSLLRLLAGLSAPDAGEVRWQGETIRNAGAAWARARLFLGHHAAVKDDLTPMENLRVANAIDGQPLADEDALRALAHMGLRGREDLPVRVLSAGQKRRVLLARTRVRPADLWILDEPLTALDTRAIDVFVQDLREHLARGGMAVITSHQPLPIEPTVEVVL